MPNTVVFVFPSAAGHVNPSLPLCQQLVRLGWHVEYLCGSEEFKSAIESTGAVYHDRNAVCAEFGIDDVKAMVISSLSEYGDPGAHMWGINFGSIATERLLPAHISFFQRHSPQLVVYCPVLCQMAHFAAVHLKIPDVSLLTAAGPGYWDAAFAAHGGAAAKKGIIETIKANEANSKAIDAIRTLVNMPELSLNTSAPVVRDYYTSMNLVSTTASLADTLDKEDAEYYDSIGKTFEFIGPLFAEKQATVAETLSGEDAASLFKVVEDASAASRKIVYVSMGTVVTGEHPEMGWNGRSQSGITGKELCQSVYRAVFAELGSSNAEANALLSPPPLLVLSVGPPPDALENISVPANAICLKSVPQVELLRMAKPALFVTNGGQNSFMESLSVGTPLVVCPGFGDQVANAAKAQRLGLGEKVDRPGESERGGDAIISYQAAVATAIQKVLGESHWSYLAKAKEAAAELEHAGGVSKAVEILVKVAGAG